MHAARSSHSPPSPARSPALVPAVKRALTLLDALAQHRAPMSLGRLASDLALPKSSVHGLCNTLLSFGYLRRLADGGFLIGPRVMGLAEAFVASTDVADEFNAFWKEASAAPEETVILSVLDGPEVVYVAARNGARPLGLAFNVGMRLPAHLAATGKAMLAFHEPEFVRRLFPVEPLARMAGGGAATLAQLQRELAVTRRRGHSIDDQSVREGVYCIGAPVFDASGRPVAGVGVCVHKARLGQDGADSCLQLVLQVAARLSKRLGAETRDPAPAPAPPASRGTARVRKGLPNEL